MSRKSLASARAQVASLDIILSAVALLLFLAVAISLSTVVSGRSVPRTIYGGQPFANIESLSATNPAIAFLGSYRVDEARLSGFASLTDEAREAIVMENSDQYAPQTADACIFFLYRAGPVQINGNDQLGPCIYSRPCPDNKRTDIYVKPVLRQERIVNMYIIICQ